MYDTILRCLFQHLFEVILKNTGSVRLRFDQIDRLTRVLNNIVQLRPGGLNILKAIGNDPQKDVCIERYGRGHAFTIQIPLADSRFIRVKCPGQIHPANPVFDFNAKQRADSCRDIDNTRKIVYDPAFVTARQFENQRDLQSRLVNKIFVSFFTMLAKHFPMVCSNDN